MKPTLYSFKRCPYAIRARIVLLLANIKCELREVRLNNKPKQMLQASPKGTVPVMVIENKIIDESIDIINWALIQNDVFKGNISDGDLLLTEELISIFDNDFKSNLDRYKYSTRYKDVDAEFHREQCFKILLDLEKIILPGRWIFGKEINKVDICILPFIRQYKIADPAWFDSQEDIPKVRKLLNNFLEYEIFKEVMVNYEVWEEGSHPVYFPTSR